MATPFDGACTDATGSFDASLLDAVTIYSFVRAHRALTDTMAGDVPDAVATVDLDGGARMLGRIEPPGAARIGARVTPLFVDHGDWTELRFCAEDASDGDATDDGA